MSACLARVHGCSHQTDPMLVFNDVLLKKQKRENLEPENSSYAKCHSNYSSFFAKVNICTLLHLCDLSATSVNLGSRLAFPKLKPPFQRPERN